MKVERETTRRWTYRLQNSRFFPLKVKIGFFFQGACMANLTCPPESHTLFSSSLQDFSLIAPAFLTYAKYKLPAILQSNGCITFSVLSDSSACYVLILAVFRGSRKGLRNFLENRTQSNIKRVVSGIGQEIWRW